MTSDKEIIEIQKHVDTQLKNSTEKFSYYIIALCVSCIGFTVYQTKEEIINVTTSFVLIAVIFWFHSIYSGLSYIKHQQHGLFLSFTSYENYRNVFIYSKNNVSRKKEISDNIEKELTRISNASIKAYKYQLNSFFIGVIFFFIWHVYQMYVNTFQ